MTSSCLFNGQKLFCTCNSNFLYFTLYIYIFASIFQHSIQNRHYTQKNILLLNKHQTPLYNFDMAILAHLLSFPRKKHFPFELKRKCFCDLFRKWDQSLSQLCQTFWTSSSSSKASIIFSIILMSSSLSSFLYSPGTCSI